MEWSRPLFYSLIIFLLLTYIHQISGLVCEAEANSRPIELSPDLALLAGDVINFKAKVNGKIGYIEPLNELAILEDECKEVPLVVKYHTSELNQFLIVPVAVLDVEAMNQIMEEHGIDTLRPPAGQGSTHTTPRLVSTVQLVHVYSGRLLGTKVCRGVTVSCTPDLPVLLPRTLTFPCFTSLPDYNTVWDLDAHDLPNEVKSVLDEEFMGADPVYERELDKIPLPSGMLGPVNPRSGFLPMKSAGVDEYSDGHPPNSRIAQGRFFTQDVLTGEAVEQLNAGVNSDDEVVDLDHDHNPSVVSKDAHRLHLPNESTTSHTSQSRSSSASSLSGSTQGSTMEYAKYYHDKAKHNTRNSNTHSNMMNAPNNLHIKRTIGQPPHPQTTHPPLSDDDNKDAEIAVESFINRSISSNNTRLPSARKAVHDPSPIPAIEHAYKEPPPLMNLEHAPISGPSVLWSALQKRRTDATTRTRSTGAGYPSQARAQGQSGQTRSASTNPQPEQQQPQHQPQELGALPGLSLQNNSQSSSPPPLASSLSSSPQSQIPSGSSIAELSTLMNISAIRHLFPESVSNTIGDLLATVVFGACIAAPQIEVPCELCQLQDLVPPPPTPIPFDNDDDDQNADGESGDDDDNGNDDDDIDPPSLLPYQCVQKTIQVPSNSTTTDPPSPDNDTNNNDSSSNTPGDAVDVQNDSNDNDEDNDPPEMITVSKCYLQERQLTHILLFESLQGIQKSIQDALKLIPPLQSSTVADQGISEPPDGSSSVLSNTSPFPSPDELFRRGVIRDIQDKLSILRDIDGQKPRSLPPLGNPFPPVESILPVPVPGGDDNGGGGGNDNGGHPGETYPSFVEFSDLETMFIFENVLNNLLYHNNTDVFREAPSFIRLPHDQSRNTTHPFPRPPPPSFQFPELPPFELTPLTPFYPDIIDFLKRLLTPPDLLQLCNRKRRDFEWYYDQKDLKQAFIRKPSPLLADIVHDRDFMRGFDPRGIDMHRSYTLSVKDNRPKPPVVNLSSQCPAQLLIPHQQQQYRRGSPSPLAQHEAHQHRYTTLQSSDGNSFTMPEFGELGNALMNVDGITSMWSKIMDGDLTSMYQGDLESGTGLSIESAAQNAAAQASQVVSNVDMDPVADTQSERQLREFQNKMLTDQASQRLNGQLLSNPKLQQVSQQTRQSDNTNAYITLRTRPIGQGPIELITPCKGYIGQVEGISSTNTLHTMSTADSGHRRRDKTQSLHNVADPSQSHVHKRPYRGTIHHDDSNEKLSLVERHKRDTFRKKRPHTHTLSSQGATTAGRAYSIFGRLFGGEQHNHHHDRQYQPGERSTHHNLRAQQFREYTQRIQEQKLRNGNKLVIDRFGNVLSKPLQSLHTPTVTSSGQPDTRHNQPTTTFTLSDHSKIPVIAAVTENNSNPSRMEFEDIHGFLIRNEDTLLENAEDLQSYDTISDSIIHRGHGMQIASHETHDETMQLKVKRRIRRPLPAEIQSTIEHKKQQQQLQQQHRMTTMQQTHGLSNGRSRHDSSASVDHSTSTQAHPSPLRERYKAQPYDRFSSLYMRYRQDTEEKPQDPLPHHHDVLADPSRGPMEHAAVPELLNGSIASASPSRLMKTMQSGPVTPENTPCALEILDDGSVVCLPTPHACPSPTAIESSSLWSLSRVLFSDVPTSSLFLSESMTNLNYDMDYASVNTFPFVIGQLCLRNFSPFEQFVSAKSAKRIFNSFVFRWSIGFNPTIEIAFDGIPSISLTPLANLGNTLLAPVQNVVNSIIPGLMPQMNPNSTIALALLAMELPLVWQGAHTHTEDTEVVTSYSITAPPQTHIIGRAIAMMGRSSVPFTMEVQRSVHVPAGIYGQTTGQLIHYDYSVPGIYEGANLVNTEYLVDVV